MQKCHCGEVFFEEIVGRSLQSGRDFRELMVEMGAGQICTACVGDLYAYCEDRLQESGLSSLLGAVSR
ncbi:MAG: hypothetical protein JJT78_06975 [Leptospira sp.]|nr:hypothetical protein [Leptospira sp.]